MMDGVEVSVMGWSSTLVNVSPCTRPSCVRNSLVCIKANVFLPVRPISWCLRVVPIMDTVQGVQKVKSPLVLLLECVVWWHFVKGQL